MANPSSPVSSRERACRRASALDLAEAIHARDPAAFFVEPRVLRRVIKLDRDLQTPGIRVPHASCYVISRSLLREYAHADELYPPELLSERVILLPRPEPEELAQFSAEELLSRYLRLTFHARVHLALEGRVAAGQLGPAALRERIRELGIAEFEEAQAVLRSEDLLLPPRDDLQAYMEFAAVFLELRRFAPQVLQQYFPAILDMEAAASVFAEDVSEEDLPVMADVAELARSTRLKVSDIELAKRSRSALARTLEAAGSTTSTSPTSSTPSPAEYSSDNGQLFQATTIQEAKQRRLLRRAEEIADVGNLVRAAILRVQAARAAGAAEPEAGQVEDECVYDLSRLAERLERALRFDKQQRAAWEESLRLLLRHCTEDRLTVEGRLLYDLQKVCVDHERAIFTIDLTEWALSLGRRAIRRPLPALREVLTCKHLRSAIRRLHETRLAEPDRERLAALLSDALHAAEEAARRRLRPAISGRRRRARDARTR